MATIPDDFDERIDGITTVIREIQHAFRQVSVQKASNPMAQCSRVIVSCHDVINKLREAEDDPDVVEAIDRCEGLIDEFRSETMGWPQRSKTGSQALSLSLVPSVDCGIKTYIGRLLDYANDFPSIFASIQRDKWLADLEKCRVRDTTLNKSQFQALVEAQDEALVSALEEKDIKQNLQKLAQEFDLVEELNSIVPSSSSSECHTNQGGTSPCVATTSPPPSEKTSRVTEAHPAAPENMSRTSPQSKQASLDVIWSTISKLEEHVGGDPAFDAQMEQLRKLAQAAMISSDEVVGGQNKPNLLKQAVITRSPVSTQSLRPAIQDVFSGRGLEIRVSEFAQGSPRIPPVPSLDVAARSFQNTHVLEYIKNHPSSDRFRLCTNISQGLAHMHTLGIVLGDFAPWNVGVDDFGNVRLRELNLSDSINGRPARGTWRSQLPDARYIPPEVITLPPEEEGGTDPNPRKSDVYAFTLLLYEASGFVFRILSGVAPWDKFDIPSIVSQVTRGNRPARPTPSVWLDNSDVWRLVQQGWHQQPENRPEMISYAHDLERWKNMLPEIQDDDTHETTHPPITPTTELFSLFKKPEDPTIMDDLSFDISHEVKMVSSLYAPFAHGGFCDIFIGRRGLEKVAMKRLRIATIGDENVVKKRFIRECEVWRKLKHPNVLDFYGIVKHGSSLFMISPFLDDGDAPSWLQSRCQDRLRVLLEAARGCVYLHTLSPKPTVHGDIKGANILIKADGEAVLADFGLSKTMNAHTSHGLKDTGTGPYMAPELFAHCNDPEIEIDSMTVPVTKTLETDVFAFGRTAIELLSGQTPYGKAAATPAIWYILLQGKRPGRPTTMAAGRWITDAMWTFINEMTHVQPECRPTMDEVVKRLERFSLELDPDCYSEDSISQSGSDAEDNDSVQDNSLEEGDTRAESDIGPVSTAFGKRRALEQAAQSKGILKPTSQKTVHKPPRSVQFANESTDSEDSDTEIT